MKLGTDAVLLGAWAEHPLPRQILDIGTGSGIIALQLAQRFAEAKITGLDIDASAAHQAAANFEASPWSARLEAIEADICQWQNAFKFDLICCNPPFYTNGFPIADTARQTARQQHELSLTALAAAAANLLQPDGLVWLILPAQDEAELMLTFAQAGLSLQQLLHIQPKSNKDVNRIIAAFGKQPLIEVKPKRLCLRDNGGQYRPEYLEIVREFYLFA